jgi:hypothetical protein
VTFPLRVILALIVIAAVAGVCVWALVAGPQAKRLTVSQRMIGVGGVLIGMALLAAWVSSGPRIGIRGARRPLRTTT